MQYGIVRCFLVGLVAAVFFPLWAGQVSAQIRIPRPRVEPRRNPPPPATNTPAQPPTASENSRASSSTNDSAQPQAPAGIIIDDGYTFFQVRGKKDYVDGKPIDKGWSLVSNLRMVGPSIPKRSAFKVVVTKAGQPVATTLCEGGIPVIPTNEARPPFLPMTAYCYNDTQLVKGDGKFGVAVHFVNGDDDSERLLRTYEIDVRKVDRVRGTNTNPQPDVPNYYISRHGEVLSNLVYMRPAGAPPYVNDTRPDTFGENRVEILYSISVTEQADALGGSEGFVRCSVDGQRIELKSDRMRNNLPQYRYYQEFHTDRLAAEFKRGSEYKDEINFRQYYAVLPLTWGRQPMYETLTKLEDHPGRWECTYRNGGDVVRTWRWTVGSNGVIAPHPEENASLTFYPGAHLVETEIPAGGSVFDKRILPEAVRASFFYGHKWQTADGKTMVGKVPAKGKPWPVPSTMR